MTPHEMMDVLCKFRVEDVVMMKVHSMLRTEGLRNPKRVPAIQPLQIIERWVTECYGGIQVMYLCRPHMTNSWESPSFSTDFVKVMEIEILPFKEAEPIVTGEGGNAPSE